MKTATSKGPGNANKGAKATKKAKTPTAAGPGLLVVPRRAALLAGHENQLDLLVRVQAPDAPAVAPRRPRLNLAFVIDRSGSMSGRPLDEAKRCVTRMVARMAPTDRAAVVVYDDQAQVLVPSRTVESDLPFRAALRGVGSGGMTNLHGGWALGAAQVGDHLAPDVVTRVVLLSDGNANQGVVDTDTVARACAERSAAGVSTSTYGLGVDFNEDLMIKMARAGAGNGYYGESAEHLMEPYEREFALLGALCGRQVTLEWTLPYGAVGTVVNDYPLSGGAVQLPDLAWGSEAWALLRVTLPRALIDAAGPGGAVDGFEVRGAWSDLDGVRHELAPMALRLTVLPRARWEAVAEDATVVQRANELEAAEYQMKARAAAQQGDWDEVARILKEARRSAGRNPWVADVLDELERIAGQQDQKVFLKETYYAARAMSSQLGDRNPQTRSSPQSPDDTPLYLRRKARQGRTSA